MQTRKIKDLKELREVCLDFVKAFSVPQLVLLEGPLAVGKSQMIRYMVEAMGFPKNEIGSPTFSLINVYKKPDKESIYHIDLFRLKNEKDLETTNFWDIFYSPAVVFMEWPQLVKNKLPPLWNKLYIDLNFSEDKKTRILKWKFISESRILSSKSNN